MKEISNINELLQVFREKEVFQAYGLKRIGVFGSFARGEHFNDIDLYIDEDIEFAKLLQLKRMLEKETGLPVDIMQKQFAEPVILYRALKDMQYAAAY